MQQVRFDGMVSIWAISFQSSNTMTSSVQEFRIRSGVWSCHLTYNWNYCILKGHDNLLAIQPYTPFQQILNLMYVKTEWEIAPEMKEWLPQPECMTYAAH